MNKITKLLKSVLSTYCVKKYYKIIKMEYKNYKNKNPSIKITKYQNPLWGGENYYRYWSANACMLYAPCFVERIYTGIG